MNLPGSFEQLLSAAATRRQVLLGGGLVLAGTLCERSFGADGRLFSLGVASGDPLPDGVVLWTRLAPTPLAGGGMPERSVEVDWEVAADERFKKIVQRGRVTARPQLAHSVHVEVAGLEPGRTYWYRFRANREMSPVGRTRTAPLNAERLRFACASCQNYEQGYYAAYRDMARQDLDLVVFLGDYIYEGSPVPGRARNHNSAEITTLVDYRNRYALYKSDPDLQAAHAAFPWIVTWDDHEVDNNYAGAIPEDDQARDAFLRRRAAAYQAYYEHMPLRLSALPTGPDMLLYRRLAFGNLAEFFVLDTRQYRSDQPCGDRAKPRCPASVAPEQTMTGPEQERWLLDGLGRSRARWNVIAQQTVMAQYDVDPRPEGTLFNMDQWDGYAAARTRLMNFLAEKKPANPVVVSGDIHSSWVFDLKRDFERPDSPTVGAEFTATAISSEFGKLFSDQIRAAMPANPHTRFFDGEKRGYLLCTLTPREWRSEIRAVADVLVPDSPVSTLAAFVVEDGRPGVHRA
jgi:alkaline phosphatase D